MQLSQSKLRKILEMKMNPCLISPLIGMLMVILACIALELNTERTQVGLLWLCPSVLVIVFQTAEMQELALRALRELRGVLSVCERTSQNQTEHLELLLKKIEKKRNKNRDLVRDTEYCREDLANLTVAISSPG